MNAFAQAWHDVSRAQPTNVNEMQAAMRLASQEGIDYSEAVERVRAGQVDSDIYRSKQ